MSFGVPTHIQPLRAEVDRFMRTEVEPAEPTINAGGPAAAAEIARLQGLAKEQGLWALGHPTHLGGGGLPFLDYVYVNELQGRSEYGQIALGTYTLQDSLMLDRYATGEFRDRYLMPLAAAEISPSFGMTEPGISSSDPTQLATAAELVDGEWVINGRKWFTTGAGRAAYTTVMCVTDPDAASPYQRYSMILVPTDTPGYELVRDTPVLGIDGGHYEISLTDVRVPEDHLLGPRGHGFVIAQERLGPGRIFHCMRWLGQAQRAFELMVDRCNERSAFGGLLADKQLMQSHIFESYSEISAARQLTLQAVAQIDSGDSARIEIGSIKVVGARMLHNVIDRAVQIYGAEGLTDDTPLSRMYREARFARIYDGPDEVHIHTVAKRLLRQAASGDPYDFAGSP